MKFSATLLCLLMLAGCGTPSVLTPGKSAREAVTQKLLDAGKQLNLSQETTTCMADQLNKGMTDDEVAHADKAMAAGGIDPIAMRAWAAASAKCVFNP